MSLDVLSMLAHLPRGTIEALSPYHNLTVMKVITKKAREHRLSGLIMRLADPSFSTSDQPQGQHRESEQQRQPYEVSEDERHYASIDFA